MGRTILEAQQREAVKHRRERLEAARRRLAWGLALLGFITGIVIAPGFGGSPLVWGILGGAAGRVAGWFVDRAWMDRSSGN